MARCPDISVFIFISGLWVKILAVKHQRVSIAVLPRSQPGGRPSHLASNTSVGRSTQTFISLFAINFMVPVWFWVRYRVCQDVAVVTSSTGCRRP